MYTYTVICLIVSYWRNLDCAIFDTKTVLQRTSLNIHHCVLGVMFLRIDSFVGSRLFNFKCHLIEVIVFNRDYWALRRAKLWECGVGFFPKSLHSTFKQGPDWRWVRVEQQQIDRIASHPACSVHWQRQGPRKSVWKSSWFWHRFGQGCKEEGRCQKVCLPPPPRSPSVRPGIQEEIRSKEWWCSCIFPYTKKEISAVRPFLSSSWHFLIDDWKWWQYINYFSFYFMTW